MLLNNMRSFLNLLPNLEAQFCGRFDIIYGVLGEVERLVLFIEGGGKLGGLAERGKGV
jgi:hypothetical protein